MNHPLMFLSAALLITGVAFTRYAASVSKEEPQKMKRASLVAAVLDLIAFAIILGQILVM